MKTDEKIEATTFKTDKKKEATALKTVDKEIGTTENKEATTLKIDDKNETTTIKTDDQKETTTQMTTHKNEDTSKSRLKTEVNVTETPATKALTTVEHVWSKDGIPGYPKISFEEPICQIDEYSCGDKCYPFLYLPISPYIPKLQLRLSCINGVIEKKNNLAIHGFDMNFLTIGDALMAMGGQWLYSGNNFPALKKKSTQM